MDILLGGMWFSVQVMGKRVRLYMYMYGHTYFTYIYIYIYTYETTYPTMNVISFIVVIIVDICNVAIIRMIIICIVF